MFLVSRVCAEFRTKTGEVICTIRPSQLLQFIEVPDSIQEDPYFQMLLSDHVIDIPANKAEMLRLEADPTKSLRTETPDTPEKTKAPKSPKPERKTAKAPTPAEAKAEGAPGEAKAEGAADEATAEAANL